MRVWQAAPTARWGVLLGAGVGVLVCTPASAQDKPPIVARAEECLKQRVEKVVAIEPDIQSAANFLVNFACATEVSGAAQYERNLLFVKATGSMFKNFPAPAVGIKSPAIDTSVTASVDPETGDVVLAKPVPGSGWNPMSAMLPQMGDQAGQITGDITPVALRQLAGDLVVAARERQLANRR